MRVGTLALLLLSTAAVAACYQQPEVPPDKPLRCTSADEAECPTGFRCVASGVCALIDCQTDEDCAQGLVCTDRTGCDLPGLDAGSDVRADGGVQGGLLPGGADALNGGAVDAPVGGVGPFPILDALDGLQGGS